MNSREEMAYIAGFIDGDGCISCFSKSSGRGFLLSFSFSNVDYEVVNFIKEKLGVSNKVMEHGALGCKQKFSLNLTGAKAKSCIRKIEPFLRLKKEVAKLALTFPVSKVGVHFSDDNIESQRELYHKMRIASGVVRCVESSLRPVYDIAWLAGFFDADGNIHISKTPDSRLMGGYRFRLCVFMTNTNRKGLECAKRVMESVGFSAGVGDIKRKIRGNRREAFRLWVYGASAQRLLKFMMPFLLIKREREHVSLLHFLRLKLLEQQERGTRR